MIKASGNLVEENFALRQELQAMKIEQQVTWSMLVDVVRKLQASSASIKAAVSSLLSYDIFWDVANQHEFLLTIDASANQTSDLVMLLSLAFRLEAERLELKPEPHDIREILTNVEMNLQHRYADKQIMLSMSQDGQVIWVDYDYLSLALVLLFDVLLSSPSLTQLVIHAGEEEIGWKLEVVGIEPVMGMYLNSYQLALDEQLSARREEKISPEISLKLMVALKLFDFQKMIVQLPEGPDFKNPLSILIPNRSTK